MERGWNERRDEAGNEATKSGLLNKPVLRRCGSEISAEEQLRRISASSKPRGRTGGIGVGIITARAILAGLDGEL